MVMGDIGDNIMRGQMDIIWISWEIMGAHESS